MHHLHPIVVVMLMTGALTLMAQRPFPTDLGATRVETYKTVDAVALKLHVYEPKGHTAQAKAPAVIFFFGGGWKNGSPKQFEHQCRYLASRGMVAITAEYRILSLHGTSAKSCVEDGKSAVRWLRKNAVRLGVDPKRIAAGGGSAGAHVAACTGIISGFEVGDTTIDSVPNAMLLFNPPMALTAIDGKPVLDPERAGDLKQRCGVDPKRLSPYHHIEKGIPPTIILHGKADTTIPFNTIEWFAEASKKAGNRCDVVGFPDEPHGFFNYGKKDNKPFIATMAKVDAFLVSLGWLAGPPTIGESNKRLPLPGESFKLNGHDAFVIMPKGVTENIPWVWYAPTLRGLPGGAETWMFKQFLEKGIAIAGIDVGESYGSPKGRKSFSALYDYLRNQRKFAAKPCLMARSRGGLMLYAWAIENPEKVSGVIGIYPVCNIASYPGIKRASGAYEQTPGQLEINLTKHNPIDRLKALAAAKIPLLHIHGDSDGTVPLSANSALLRERYVALGGPMEIIEIPGGGHDMSKHWFQSQKLTDFAINRALAQPIKK